MTLGCTCELQKPSHLFTCTSSLQVRISRPSSSYSSILRGIIYLLLTELIYFNGFIVFNGITLNQLNFRLQRLTVLVAPLLQCLLVHLVAERGLDGLKEVVLAVHNILVATDQRENLQEQ